MNLDWVAGAVVVLALFLACIGLLALAVWDVVRQSRGENLSITASSWVASFFQRWPIAAMLVGLVVGILMAHFGWFQRR